MMYLNSCIKNHAEEAQKKVNYKRFVVEAYQSFDTGKTGLWEAQHQFDKTWRYLRDLERENDNRLCGFDAPTEGQLRGILVSEGVYKRFNAGDRRVFNITFSMRDFKHVIKNAVGEDVYNRFSRMIDLLTYQDQLEFWANLLELEGLEPGLLEEVQEIVTESKRGKCRLVYCL